MNSESNGGHPADDQDGSGPPPDNGNESPPPAEAGGDRGDGGDGGDGNGDGPTWYGATSALIWVFIWICLAIWMAMGTLASNQFHDDLDALKQRGGGGVETSLVALQQRVHLLQQLEASDRSALELRKHLSGIEEELNVAVKKREEFGKNLEETNQEGAALMTKQTLLDQQFLAALPDQAMDLEAERQKLAGLLERIEPTKLKLEANIKDVDTDIDRLTVKKTDVDVRLSLAETESSRIRGELAKSPELTKLALDHQKSRLLYLSIFFEMPKNIVILMLALAMGALGSTIHLSRTAFGSSQYYPVSWYLMRPFQGMVLALAMYVMVKSGQHAIVEPSAANEDLNPFTISLLAIVSGLFSEKAYERLQRASEAVFERKARQ